MNYTNTLVAALYFSFAYLIGTLQMEFLQSRDDNRALKAASIDAVVNWAQFIPMYLLVFTLNWQVVIAEGLAQGLATYQAIQRKKKA